MLSCCMHLEENIYYKILFSYISTLLHINSSEDSGHQRRTQSDGHQPQVSVPLISRPVASYGEGRTTPL